MLFDKLEMKRLSLSTKEATIIGFEKIQPENKNETPTFLYVEDNLT